MTVVAPADCLKSVRIRCVIEHVRMFVMCLCYFDHHCLSSMSDCHTTVSDLVLFLIVYGRRHVV